MKLRILLLPLFLGLAQASELRAPTLIPALNMRDVGLSMNTVGYAALPPSSVMTPAASRIIISEFDHRRIESAQLSLFAAGKPAPSLDETVARKLLTRQAVELIQAWALDDEARLKEALPEENPVLDDVRIHIGLSPNITPHADAGYITLIDPWRGAGTLLYPAGREAAYQASERQTLTMTAKDREVMTGVPSTLHSSPPHAPSAGRVFITRGYKNPKTFVIYSKAHAVAQRIRRAAEALRKKTPGAP